MSCRFSKDMLYLNFCLTNSNKGVLICPNDHRRHDISDAIWSILEPQLPGRKGSWGGVATNNRLFINAVFWILRTGAPWRDLPPDYGGWKNTCILL